VITWTMTITELCGLPRSHLSVGRSTQTTSIKTRSTAARSVTTCNRLLHIVIKSAFTVIIYHYVVVSVPVTFIEGVKAWTPPFSPILVLRVPNIITTTQLQLQLQLQLQRQRCQSQPENRQGLQQGKQQQYSRSQHSLSTSSTSINLFSSSTLSITRTRLHMALVPLPAYEIEELLVVGSPSGLQYATYWGQTRRETYNRLLESSLVGFIGVSFSYFLSFVVGGFIATMIGTLFAFWAVLSPDFKARQRNWEFLGGRQLADPWIFDNDNENYDRNNAGLYGSMLLGRIDDVCVVENNGSIEEYELNEFQNYNSDYDELEEITGSPYLIRIKINDDENRELQIHARLKEEYLGIEIGMPVAGILLSTSDSFEYLSAMTDIYIPDSACFVGDYPYLNRPGMESLLESDDDLWNTLQSQSQLTSQSQQSR